MAAPAPPPCLAVIGPFLRRADETETTFAGKPELLKMAYYCRFAAAEKGLEAMGSLGPADRAAAQAYLGELLGRLEADRVRLGIDSGDKERDLGNLVTFALTVFKRADDVDRAGAADKNTALAFFTAANYMDVGRTLGFRDEKLDQMSKYAKVRTSELRAAFKEGRAPVPPAGAGDGTGFDLDLSAYPSPPASTPAAPAAAGSTGAAGPSVASPSPFGAPAAAAASTTPAADALHAAFPSGGAPAAPAAAASPYASPYGAAPAAPAASALPYGGGGGGASPFGAPPAAGTGSGTGIVGGLMGGLGSLASAAASTLASTIPHASSASAASTGAAAAPRSNSGVTSPVPTASAGSVRAAARVGFRGVPQDAMLNSIEYTKHALAALKEDDPDHAAALLRQALASLGR